MSYEKYVDYIEVVKTGLKKSRFNHTINVMEMAIKLAEIYDVNEKNVVIASLYHDYAKNLSDGDLKDYIEKYNLDVDDFIMRNIFLAHGIVASHMVKNIENISDVDILNAIKYHTFGRSGMSKLEKIIYIADAIEIDRKYKHVEFIRELSYKDLDIAIITYIDYFIEFAIKENLIIHTNTLDLRNEILTNGVLPRRV